MANDIASIFQALADPTRRSIYERVSARPSPVGKIAAGLPVSRPAVSQHLKLLKEAGLVTDSAEGSRRIYRIDPRGLATVRTWLDGFWAAALTDFEQFANTAAEEDQ